MGCSYEFVLDNDIFAVQSFWQRNSSCSNFKLCDVIFLEI